MQKERVFSLLFLRKYLYFTFIILHFALFPLIARQGDQWKLIVVGNNFVHNMLWYTKKWCIFSKKTFIISRCARTKAVL